jgi:hypothetical protein
MMAPKSKKMIFLIKKCLFTRQGTLAPSKHWSMPMLTILLQHTMDGDQIRVVNLILPGAGGAFSHKAPGSAMG